MSEVNSAVDAQVADDTQSQVDTTDVKAPDAQVADDKADNPFKAELTKKNNENKSLRDRLKKFEDAEKAASDAELKESQRLAKQLEELGGTAAKREGALKNLLLQEAVREHGTPMGARSMKALAKLIDSDVLEFDLEEMTVKGVDAELKRLKKDDPDLFVSGGTDGGAGNGNKNGSAFNMNDHIRHAAGRN
jgi:hypothetical protein